MHGNTGRGRRNGLRAALAAGLAMLPLTALAAPFAYVGNRNGNNVAVFDTASNTSIASVAVGSGPFGVAVSPDGSRVYVTNSQADTVSVIDTRTNAVIDTIPVGSSPAGIAAAPDGAHVYVANYGNHTVSVIDTGSDAVIATILMPPTPIGLTVSPGGNRLYVSLYNGAAVAVVDTSDYRILATVPNGNFDEGIALNPRGNLLYTANSASNSVSVIDTTTNRVVAMIGVGNNPDGVAVSPDGTRAYVSNVGDGTISVINTQSESVIATITAGTDPFGVSVSPDGTRLYVTNQGSNTLSVIDTANNTVIASPAIGQSPYALGDFVGPGALVALNSSDSGPAGAQLSGTVPALINATTCSASDALEDRPLHGTVTFDTGTGAWTYTPSSATYSGPDAFTWRGEAASSCTAADSPTLPVSNRSTVSLTVAPVLSEPGNLTVQAAGTASEAFALTGSAPFGHTVASNDATILPAVALTILPAACGADEAHLSCRIAVTNPPAVGTATVTLTADDRYGTPVTTTFSVHVVPPPGPALSGLSNVTVPPSTPATESFHITGSGALSVTASSSNTNLLPDANISGASQCTGTGSCSLTLGPVANQTGTTDVTVTVADAYGQSTSADFTFTAKAASSGGGGGGTLGPGVLFLLLVMGLAAIPKKRRRPDSPAG